MANKSKKFRRFMRPGKKWGLIYLLILVLLIIGAYFYHRHHQTPVAQQITTAGKATDGAKSNVSGQQKPAAKTPSSSTDSASGAAVDTHGQATATTDPSQWIVSKSGVITVKQPTADATLQNGSVLSGSASVSTVNYRLISDNSGVIATGALSVNSGNFSGTLQFPARSGTGRLDVYSTDSEGVELNEIEIYVSF